MIRKNILLSGVMFLLTMVFCLSGNVEARNLSLNSKGADVVMVQQCLKDIGYNIKKVSGVYDNSTKRAVLAFQRDHKIKISGIVDDKTMEAIKNAPKSNHNSTDNTVKTKEKPAITARTPKPVKKTAVPESQPFVDRHKVPAIIKTAKNLIGVPYVSGGTTPKGFDCSGYLQYIFEKNGLTIPRTADVQYKLGKNYKLTALEAGDLVFFQTDASHTVTHCGLYIGNGQFIHASSSKGVRIDRLADDYWKKAFFAAKHIIK
ncbi:MAG: C40 family peptidase [Anaerovibrio sp.]|nr:C40 family peptidase [Anaerovibrio sp.]